MGRKILRVDMSNLRTSTEDFDKGLSLLGGRALTAALVLKEVPAWAHPLGRGNKLVLAPGLLAGSGLSSSGRVSVGGKSPLTRGIKESNAGGTTGNALAKLGIGAIIVEGCPNDRTSLHIVVVGEHTVEVRPAPNLRGKGVYETAELLAAEYGPGISAAIIGPAGEALHASACIANLDRNLVPSRMNGRGGLGAVMGSKGIKALVIQGTSRGGQGCVPADARSFFELARVYHKRIRESAACKVYAEYGTSAMVDVVNALQGLPVYNFQRGSTAEIDRISAETMRGIIRKRGGLGCTTEACMDPCTIRCSNIYVEVHGKPVVAPLEYESIVMLGPNLGIFDLDVIAELNRACNDVGVDSIEIGAALGVLMEAGALRWGDGKTARDLILQIERGGVLGRVLAEGAETCGRVFGVRRVPSVKGQALPAYDPRAIKSLGVTFATSAMGADHTAGYTVRVPVDHKEPRGQARISREAQIMTAVYDSLGLCIFVRPCLGGDDLTLLANSLSAYRGVPFSKENLVALGEEVLIGERRFNRGAGLGRSTDRLPEFFYEEEQPDAKTRFDVPDAEVFEYFPDNGGLS